MGHVMGDGGTRTAWGTYEMRMVDKASGAEVVTTKRGQVHLSVADDLAGRCAGLTLANRWVLASTIARKSSRP